MGAIRGGGWVGEAKWGAESLVVFGGTEEYL